MAVDGFHTRGVVAVLLGIVTFSGCTPHPVGPARTFATYEGKAVTTAESALSRVETVRLTAEAAAAGNAFGPYVSVAISDQEDALTGVQGTFSSIQPPDERSDRLRAELRGVLNDAVDHVADVRIAARRGELDALGDISRALTHDADALRGFIGEHSSS